MKKGAVAGAIVWSAPLLTSTPAFAASAQCSGSRPCTTWYYAKTTESDDHQEGDVIDECTSGAEGDESSCADLRIDASCDPDAEVPVVLNNACDLADFDIWNTGTTAQFVYPPGAIPIFVQLKPGSMCYSYKWDSENETFVFFSMDDGQNQTATQACADAASFTVSGNLKDGYVVDATWPGGGCLGMSHVGTYFCL